MHLVAITGGVACGKSSVSRILLKDLCDGDGDYFFSSDQSVGQLLTASDILQKLRSSFGQDVISHSGGVDRAWLRNLVFDNDSARKELESILHPRVLEEARKFVRKKRNAEIPCLLEVPLLYEVDFPIERSVDLVVGASISTQKNRLINRRGLKNEIAEKILQAQWPIQKKTEKADLVIWNDGTEKSLQRQCAQVSRILEKI